METSVLMVPLPEWRIHHPDFAWFAVDNWGVVPTALACDGGRVTALDGWLCEGPLAMAAVRAQMSGGQGDRVDFAFREPDCLERDRFERAAKAWVARSEKDEKALKVLLPHAVLCFLDLLVDRTVAHVAPFAVARSYGIPIIDR